MTEERIELNFIKSKLDKKKRDLLYTKNPFLIKLRNKSTTNEKGHKLTHKHRERKKFKSKNLQSRKNDTL